MILISCIGQLFCGMACVTSASRMTYAFSRDRAIPGWRIWTRLNHNRTPVGAVLFVVACALIITLPALWNVQEGIPVAFFAVVSVCVIGLYIAYAIPIFLRWRIGDAFKAGPWTNGPKYKWMNLAATIWVGIITVIFCLPFTPAGVPWNDEFTWSSVNYAPLTVGGLILAVGIWWLVQRAALVHRPGPQRSQFDEAAGVRGEPNEPTGAPGPQPGASPVGPPPVIGLCTALERARWSVWDAAGRPARRATTSTPCTRAGGIALLLPPDPAAVEDPDRAARPHRRAAARRRRRHRPGDATAPSRIRRRRARCPSATRSSWRSPRRAMERDLPFLGICRGMQVMNVARGGTLDPAPARRTTATRTTGGRSARSTTPTTTCGWRTGSLAARAAHEELHGTKSHHHQGVDRIGDGLAGHRLGDARRAARGARGAGQPLRARRAVAPGGRRDLAD